MKRTLIFLAVGLVLVVSIALRSSTAQDAGSADKEKLGKGEVLWRLEFRAA